MSGTECANVRMCECANVRMCEESSRKLAKESSGVEELKYLAIGIEMPVLEESP